MASDKKPKTDKKDKKAPGQMTDYAGKSNDGLTNKLQSGSKKTTGKA